MKGEQLSPARTFKVTFGTGDELLSGLTEFAAKNHIAAARITGLGGFITATLGWGDPPKGAFKKIAIDQKCELVSLIGNISLRDGKPYVHLHAVVSMPDGSTKGGHLIDAHVSPIAEIFIVEAELSPAPIPKSILSNTPCHPESEAASFGSGLPSRRRSLRTSAAFTPRITVTVISPS